MPSSPDPIRGVAPASFPFDTRIDLRHLFDLQLEIGAIHTVGATPQGHRVIADLAGGRFEGDRLSGRVRPSGGDWGLFMPDGTLAVDGRCCLETEDGTLIYGIYTGRWAIRPETMVRLSAPEGVDPDEYTLRIQFLFETAEGPHAWMNRILAIATGRKTDAGIAYRVFEVC